MTERLRIVFVGESWQGSFARSMREALAALPGVDVDDIGEDHYFPKGRALVVRSATRLLRPWLRAGLVQDIQALIADRRPQVLMVYKGAEIPADTLKRMRKSGLYTVNVFPDYSPHAYGDQLKQAVGEYDLVISTKPFHPAVWRTIYGYSNRCVCVPHGYDPRVHCWPDPPGEQDFDVALAATWRQQYSVMMQRLLQSLGGSVRVGIAGNGWDRQRDRLPASCEVMPAITGRAYGEWLRRARIVISPVHRDVVLRGVRQPGDEDSTRTYELAAMGCFFLHCRTPFAQTVFDEATEVPMWDDVDELAALVRHYLPLDAERRAMAARAHRRAVPAYSVPSRAKEVLEQVKSGLANHAV